MKATNISNDVLYELSTIDESWVQGTLIRGSLKVVNKSQKTISLDNLRVILSFGEFKKVHSGTFNSWPILLEEKFDKITLKSNEEKVLKWNLKLTDNSPISEKNASPFFLYGNGEIENLFNIQLNIEIKPILKEFLKIFENFFRFTINTIKNKKDGLDVKLVPPKTNKHINQINALMSFDNDDLKIQYTFSVNVVDAKVGTVRVKKEKRVAKQVLRPFEYLIDNQYINQDHLLKILEELIKRETPKLI